MVKHMEINLYRAYSSYLDLDNVEYPIFKLADNSYLCISYSIKHHSYYINTYTEEEFIEQEFSKDELWDNIFECVTREDVY